MKFNLPSFTITVRDPSDDERATQCNDHQRDYYAIDIRKKGDARGVKLTMCVGSPVIMTAGESWNEAAAARSAMSFANAPWCMDVESEREWSKANGEALSNEAFCHKILGAELREGLGA